MNEIDVLKKIASNLTERKNSAALSNYRVLCSNIAFYRDAWFWLKPTAITHDYWSDCMENTCWKTS